MLGREPRAHRSASQDLRYDMTVRAVRPHRKDAELRSDHGSFLEKELWEKL